MLFTRLGASDRRAARVSFRDEIHVLLHMAALPIRTSDSIIWKAQNLQQCNRQLVIHPFRPVHRLDIKGCCWLRL